MRKILLATLLIAGTTLGFAKDNVKNEVETATKKEAKQIVQTPQADSNEEAETLKATCMDIHGFYHQTIINDGNGQSHVETVYEGSMVVTYECDKAETSLYLWID